MECVENSSCNVKCAEPSGSFSEKSYLVLSSNSLISPISKSKLRSSLRVCELTSVSYPAPLFAPHIDGRGGAEQR